MTWRIEPAKATVRSPSFDIRNVFRSLKEKQLDRRPVERDAEITRRDRLRRENGNSWFIPEETRAIDALASLIVPSDDDTPGADEMDVLGSSASHMIGKLVSSSPDRQTSYTEGLIVLDELAERRHGSIFADLPRSSQLNLLRHLDIAGRYRRNSHAVRTRLQRKLAALHRALEGTYPASKWFPLVVQDILAAFYSSEVSWIWLDYDGPPMPDGYSELDVRRSRKGTSDGKAVRELAAAGYGLPMFHPSAKRPVADVVIIGSGAGGAVVAKELSEAGVSVVVLEAGKRFNPYLEYRTDSADFQLNGPTVFDPRDPRRDRYTWTGKNGFSYNRAKGVGGTTLKYCACSLRFHESDFRARTEDGVADDWPITYEELEQYYTRVEYELGVSGPGGADANPFEPPRSKPYPTPAHRMNLASLAIKRGADKLGLHMVREPLAIPTAEWNGRPACINAGTCTLGCAITAKSSMDVTYLAKGEKTGNLEIRSECTARRITLAPDGRARGVIYFDSEGNEKEIRAHAIVLAANAVETPRLLLLSDSSRFPDGLANSSGLVGKNFMEHLAVFSYGVFPNRIDPWRGTPTGGMIQDYYATRKSNSFARGWTNYAYCGEHWPLNVARRVPGWGAEHKQKTRDLFGHAVALCSVGEQLPDVRNRVTLDPVVKDQFGLPVPCLTNELGENDRAMIKAIKTSLKELFEASGAKEILENEYGPGWSCHYLGTCRMGTDAQRSVVDAWGRAHDVPNLFIGDGSVFVTGAAVNPALTISALATRTAMGILAALRRNEL